MQRKYQPAHLLIDGRPLCTFTKRERLAANISPLWPCSGEHSKMERIAGIISAAGVKRVRVERGDCPNDSRGLGVAV